MAGLLGHQGVGQRRATMVGEDGLEDGREGLGRHQIGRPRGKAADPGIAIEAKEVEGIGRQVPRLADFRRGRCQVPSDQTAARVRVRCR